MYGHVKRNKREEDLELEGDLEKDEERKERLRKEMGGEYI
jgi:hypothetical protein